MMGRDLALRLLNKIQYSELIKYFFLTFPSIISFQTVLRQGQNTSNNIFYLSYGIGWANLQTPNNQYLKVFRFAIFTLQVIVHNNGASFYSFNSLLTNNRPTVLDKGTTG